MQGIQTTPEGFWARGVRAGTCWEWTGRMSNRGYGRLSYHGKSWNVSRLAWTLAYGRIPEGLNVLHRCDNPPCFEPTHLFLGTLTENQVDARDKGRLRVRAGATQLTPAQVAEVKTLVASGQKMDSVARTFGVSRATVHGIIRGRRWV